MTEQISEGLSEATIAELHELAGRYPQARSALLPMLHLVQSDRGPRHQRGHRGVRRDPGHHRGRGVGVATFYTMYKRRPMGKHHVGVCTNTLCAVMGGDVIFERLKRPPRRRQRRDHRGRQGHARAHRVQRGLRLRAGDDGQLGVLRQPDARVGRSRSSTSCAPARPCRPPAAPRSPRGARPSASSPASRTASSTRDRPPAGASLAGLEIAARARLGGAAARRVGRRGAAARSDRHQAEAAARPTPPAPRPRPWSSESAGRRDAARRRGHR